MEGEREANLPLKPALLLSELTITVSDDNKSGNNIRTDRKNGYYLIYSLLEP